MNQTFSPPHLHTEWVLDDAWAVAHQLHESAGRPSDDWIKDYISKLAARLCAPPPPVTTREGEHQDWWDAAALAISDEVLGRRFKSIDEVGYSDARILFGIVATVEAVMINAGVAPGNAIDSAVSTAIERCAKVAETFHEDDDGIDRQVKRHVAAAACWR